ncbi:MAG: hypothetical protein JWM05_1303 [Acidimicrobiales bacterium]|nr:hypothetical protein [Acidimicrobiales bacterium]
MPSPPRRPHLRRPFGALVVGIALLAGCSSQRVPTKFTSSVHKSFVTGCTQTTGKEDPRIGSKAQIASYCECAYTAITKRMAFKDFKKVTDDLTDKPGPLPASFQKAYASCTQLSETKATTTTSTTPAGKTGTTTKPSTTKPSTTTTKPSGSTP